MTRSFFDLPRWFQATSNIGFKIPTKGTLKQTLIFVPAESRINAIKLLCLHWTPPPHSPVSPCSIFHYMGIWQRESGALISNKALVLLRLKRTSSKLLSLQRKFQEENYKHHSHKDRTLKTRGMKSSTDRQARSLRGLRCAGPGGGTGRGSPRIHPRGRAQMPATNQGAERKRGRFKLPEKPLHPRPTLYSRQITGRVFELASSLAFFPSVT